MGVLVADMPKMKNSSLTLSQYLLLQGFYFWLFLCWNDRGISEFTKDKNLMVALSFNSYVPNCQVNECEGRPSWWQSSSSPTESEEVNQNPTVCPYAGFILTCNKYWNVWLVKNFYNKREIECLCKVVHFVQNGIWPWITYLLWNAGVWKH